MKAFELLEAKDWCQGAMARDKHGCTVSTGSPQAAAFCALGALDYCCAVGSVFTAGCKLVARVGDIAVWNDAPNRTKAEVVAVLKELDL